MYVYVTQDAYHSRHVPFGPGMFERSRDCPEKQPNSPYVDFTKRKGEEERKRKKERERDERRYERTYHISEVSLGESLDGVVRWSVRWRQPDKGLMTKVYS